MSYKEIESTTMCSNNYNHAHRELTSHCSYCRAHGGCNITHKYTYSINEINWKVVTKNKKQWMGKPVPRQTKRISWGRGGFLDSKYWD